MKVHTSVHAGAKMTANPTERPACAQRSAGSPRYSKWMLSRSCSTALMKPFHIQPTRIWSDCVMRLRTCCSSLASTSCTAL